MAEANGLGMKLFGRKIILPQCRQIQTSPIPVKSELMDTCNRTNMEGNRADDTEEPEKSSCVADAENKSPNLVKLNEQQADSKSEEDSTQDSTTTDEEKVFKKPDKIVQCPRCNSLDTKFCYFNNYNVKQPRHFCKNCQRYWTAGGTMRNVPIGAGRRRNKHLASQFHQIIVSADSDNQSAISGLEHSPFRSSSGNGTVLRFGPADFPPLCESMKTALNLKDRKRCIDVGTVDHVEVREEMCGSSSLTTADTQATELPVRDTSLSVQCYPVSPWVLPWNPCWNSSTSMAATHCPSEGEGSNLWSCSPSSMPWYPMPVLAVPGICPPNMPLQFLPASSWGSMPLWPAGTGTNFSLTQTSSTSNRCHSGKGSPTLGKHSRDTNFAEEESDKCNLVPKTLRMGDPIEASKSPIWPTLGVKRH